MCKWAIDGAGDVREENILVDSPSSINLGPQARRKVSVNYRNWPQCEGRDLVLAEGIRYSPPAKIAFLMCEKHSAQDYLDDVKRL